MPSGEVECGVRDTVCRACEERPHWSPVPSVWVPAEVALQIMDATWYLRTEEFLRAGMAHENILEEVGLKLDALNGFEEGVGFHT